MTPVQAASREVVSTMVMTLVGVVLLAFCVQLAKWGYAIAVGICIGVHLMLLIVRIDRYLDARKREVQLQLDEARRRRAELQRGLD